MPVSMMRSGLTRQMSSCMATMSWGYWMIGRPSQEKLYEYLWLAVSRTQAIESWRLGVIEPNCLMFDLISLDSLENLIVFSDNSRTGPYSPQNGSPPQPVVVVKVVWMSICFSTDL